MCALTLAPTSPKKRLAGYGTPWDAFAMKGYGQLCPVAKTAEIFAQRWTPLILRELCFGPQGFNDLRRAMPLVARSVLTQRLSELTFGGVIVADKKPGIRSQYRLTAAGEEFLPLIQLMSKWGQTWGQGNISPTELDPALLVWANRSIFRPCGCFCHTV